MPAAAAVAVAGVLLLTGATSVPVMGVQPPDVIIGAAPVDGPPGPELPTKQDKGCLAAGLVPNSDPAQVPPPELALDLTRARALSRGAGVTVAVLDTGVTPNVRLPNLIPGGDYVQAGGDGLFDCDAHGTLIAGIIGAATDSADGFAGVAPDAKILSIRSRSGAFSLDSQTSLDTAQQTALDVRTLARAITHAADLGAQVITVSVPICMQADLPVDHSVLAAAIGYAVHVRGALVVSGAGNSGNGGCEQNPPIDPAGGNDPRNWESVKTIVTPAWYNQDVVSVGFTTATGDPMDDSLTGPWITVGAPGTGIESVGPGGPALVNGVGPPDKLVPVGGASFAAAYVSGVAALLRSLFPNETPAQIAARLRATAHAPARGTDNVIGAGVIDPLAALSLRTPPVAPAGTTDGAPLTMPPAPRSPDGRPRVVMTVVFAAALAIWPLSLVLRSKRRRG